MLQSGRSATAARPMRWSFPVAPGSYNVRLYFAEMAPSAQAAGARVFDVIVEGRKVLDDYDTFAEVGGYRGVMKSFTVTSDTDVDINFRSESGSASVKGIEVLPSGAAARPAPRPEPEPTADPQPPPKVDPQPADGGQGSGGASLRPEPIKAGSCQGTVVPPGANLPALVNGSSNKTFCLAAATYDIGTASIQPGPGTKLIGAPVTVSSPGAIAAPTKIVGRSPQGVIYFARPATGVVLENLDICCAPGTKSNSDSSTKQLGRGINGNSGRALGLVVRYSRIHGNANAGIGGIGEGARIEHVELDHNGSESYLGCCAGGIKSANFYTITRSYVHHNVGHGIWVDVGGSFVVTDNVVVANSQNGIRYELSSGFAKILRNVVQGNSTSGDRPGAGIEVNSADDAEVAHNVLGGNFNAGILFRGSRGPVGGSAYANILNGDEVKGCGGISCSGNMQTAASSTPRGATTSTMRLQS